MSDPRFAEIEGHRPYLMRYALAQLRDAQLAEEAVQEALVAALESLPSFGGKSTLRTWLTSILRFKVVDLQRRAIADRVNVELVESSGALEEEGAVDDLFDATGHWRSAPQAWSDPEACFEHHRVQLLGDPASRPARVARVPGEELVRKGSVSWKLRSIAAKPRRCCRRRRSGS